MSKEAEKHLKVALGGNMYIATLTPRAFGEIMEDYKKKSRKDEIEQAHMAGQINDRCKEPSYSDAQNYYNSL